MGLLQVGAFAESDPHQRPSGDDAAEEGFRSHTTRACMSVSECVCACTRPGHLGVEGGTGSLVSERECEPRQALY